MSDQNERPPNDVAEGFRFLHLLTMQLKQDLYETRAKLGALIGELADAGKVDLNSTTERLASARAVEYEHIKNHAYVQIGEPGDKYAVPETDGLDCASRLHLCKAVCCSFSFRLTVQDLDEGVLRWDYAEPYAIKQKPSGYCTHSCGDADGGCDVYHHRPTPCRQYDCRNDERVWKDFDAMIPADDLGIHSID